MKLAEIKLEIGYFFWELSNGPPLTKNTLHLPFQYIANIFRY